MRFPLHDLASELEADLVVDTEGQTVDTDPTPVVDGLSTDSRTVRPGQLFAAVRGVRDGHEFVEAARSAGASAALVRRAVAGGTSVVVDDVGRGLERLSRHARERIGGSHVVGITGSVGKTTTKDLLAGVLARRYSTAASERSFNNELGVPLTLANAPDDVEALVVEMGARGAGHIAHLCSLATPTVGVVTAVEAVHTEVMGGLEAIAAAKGELVEAVPGHGLVVLNADYDLVAAMATRTEAAVLTFGERGDVRAEQVTVGEDLRPRFRLCSDWGASEVRLAVRGSHNVANALAAATVGLALEVAVEEVADALGVATHSPWRMELLRTAAGTTLLNDAYNAGPASTAAALRSLAALPARRRVAVLGVMAELGDDAPAHHREIAALATDLDIEVLAVGTGLYGGAPLDLDAAERALASMGLGSEDAVLLKGSRVAGLERLASVLGAS